MTRRERRAGMNRRELIAAAALGVAFSLARRGVRGTARAEAGSTVAPPRYWITIVPTGGFDPVWTTDPRTPREVTPGVDVPYPSAQIVDAGTVRLGPHLAALASVVPDLAIVNGILSRSANHYSGLAYISRLRTRATMRTPSVLDIIGEHRDSQALAHVSLNAQLRQAQTGEFFGNPVRADFGGGADLFAQIDQLAPEELSEIASGLEAEIRASRGSASRSERDASFIRSIDQVRALFARAAECPRFSPTTWFDGELASRPDAQEAAADIQRALWLIENDLAATVTIYVGNSSWDSHFGNTAMQSRMNPLLAAALARLLAELASRRTVRGALREQTAVLVASEIGRFPFLNLAGGKDHFPQLSLLASGPCFRSGVRFGPTGKEMQALPVSRRTGRHDPGSSRLTLDDLGVTALRVAGLKPEIYGVTGDELSFLRRS